jgi:bifunctional non-homologous end joining protein LigD
VVHAIQRLAVRTLILDGEVAIYDRQLVSRFEWLRHAAPPELATPPLLMVFDCLYADGRDLRAKTLHARRMTVEALLLHQDLRLPVRRLSDDGQKAWREVLEKGWEGLVAKDPMAPYVGGRTLKWLKVKQQKYREGERGWEPKGKS